MAAILPDWMFPGRHVMVQFGPIKEGGQLCEAVVLEIDPQHNSARVEFSSSCADAEQLGFAGWITEFECHRLHPLKHTDRRAHNHRGVAHHNDRISASSTAPSRPHRKAKRSSFSFLRRPLSVFGQAHPSDSELSESENEISQSRSREHVATRDRGGTTSSLASWNSISVSSIFQLWGQGQPRLLHAPASLSIARYPSDEASTTASEIRSRGNRYEIDDDDGKASQVPARRDSLFPDFIPNMFRGWSAIDATGERAVLPDARMPVIDESGQVGPVEDEGAYEIGQEVYVLVGNEWCPGTVVENDDDNKLSSNYRVRFGSGKGTQVRSFWPSHVRVMNETQG